MRRLLGAGIKQLRREPAYAIAVGLSLLVGLSSAGAILTVARAVIVRSLPYPNAEHLFVLQEYHNGSHRDPGAIASANLDAYRSAPSAIGIGGVSYGEYVLSDGARSERVIGAAVDASVFRLLGSRPSIGRFFLPGEDGVDAAKVAVLSDNLWRDRYASAPSVIGTSIPIDGEPHIVVGIAPPNFEFPRPMTMAREIALWVPRAPPPPMMARRGQRDLLVIGRIKAGRTLHELEHDAGIVLAASGSPTNAGWSVRAMSLRDAMIGPARPTLEILVASASLLLAIAVINASAAGIVRVTRQRQTTSIRLALGASGALLIEQLFVEYVVIAAVVGAASIPVSVWIRAILTRLVPTPVPRVEGIALDGPAILLIVGLALACCAVTAIAPAIALRRQTESANRIAGESLATAGSLARRRFAAVFVTTQLTLAAALFVVVARLYTAYARLERVDPGFSAAGVTTATIALPGMRYRRPTARAALTSRLLERVRAIPGVDRAAVTSLAPLSGGLMTGGFDIGGTVRDSTRSAALRAVSAGFFSTVGIRIMNGRPIDDRDVEGANPVVVVNRSLETRAFAGRSALHSSIRLTPPGSDSAREFEIVGVADDAREKDLIGPPMAIVYFSDQQASFPHMVLLVHTVLPLAMRPIEQALRDIDPTLALDDVTSLAARVADTYSVQRFLLSIVTMFAMIAALLIVIGVYSAVAFVTLTERRSIGVRMALGATSGNVLSEVMRRTMFQAVTAGVLGLAAAYALVRLFNAVAVVDRAGPSAAPFAGAGATVLVALIAAWMPAWRASRIDPIAIIRDA